MRYICIMLNDGKYGCGGVWCVVLFACLHLLAGCVSADGDKDDSALAQSRVLRAQRLRNMTPGDEILPELRAIVDSMRRDGRGVYYYAAVNVLVDQLFSQTVSSRPIQRLQGCLQMPLPTGIPLLWRLLRVCEGRCFINSFSRRNLWRN